MNSRVREERARRHAYALDLADQSSSNEFTYGICLFDTELLPPSINKDEQKDPTKVSPADGDAKSQRGALAKLAKIKIQGNKEVPIVLRAIFSNYDKDRAARSRSQR